MLDRDSTRRAVKSVLIIKKVDKIFETVKNGAALDILGRRANQVA